MVSRGRIRCINSFRVGHCIGDEFGRFRSYIKNVQRTLQNKKSQNLRISSKGSGDFATELTNWVTLIFPSSTSSIVVQALKRPFKLFQFNNNLGQFVWAS